MNKDYNLKDIIKFLKEELERIIESYPRQTGGIIRESQAFATWFIHQEIGVGYEEANQSVIDETNDCGVDFIWIDNENQQILIGQVEYDTSVWSRDRANLNKAINTFSEFDGYVNGSGLPENLHEAAKTLWRNARQKIREKFDLRYIYVTPKHFSTVHEEKIKEKSGLPNYEFFTYDDLIERGQEFLDGQTGMSSFSLHYTAEPLEIPNDFGNVYVMRVGVKEIHRIVEVHEKQKQLKSLFASNVRSYLNVKKRSREIGDAMRKTLLNEPERFLVCNNGITIQCSKASPRNQSLFLERASISNGCQTVMNINRFFRENEHVDPKAEVLITIIELTKNGPTIASEIARSRNFQNPVDNRDLMSNDPLLVTLHHRLYADRLSGSEKRYYLLRKQGEKQTLLREEPNARGKFMWIDADYLARCIVAVIRQEPFISQQGTNDIFGKYFRKIFPGIHDPSHSRCKYAYWLVESVYYSYDYKAKWKGIKDQQINLQKDFKSRAAWITSALVAHELARHFSFNENLEKRFVDKCERYWFGKNREELEAFQDLTDELLDDAFRLLYKVAKNSLGTKLPKAKDIYSTYDDLFKGPNYDYLISRIKRDEAKGAQQKFRRSMGRFVQYLRNN